MKAEKLALLRVDNYSLRFGANEVVKGVSFQVNAGERVALVGESGSGKTITALSILGLQPTSTSSGSIVFEDKSISALPGRELEKIRGKDIAMIFQEPMTALNPLYTIGHQVMESLRIHEGLGTAQARDRALQLLKRTGIRDPEHRIDAYPHQLSGGQRQRAMIAMALACKPKLLIADEPTTALDMTIRVRIVELLIDIQQQEDMAVLLITHDLNLVRKFAQRVLVMKQGKLVEEGQTEQIFTTPRHEYTRKLIDSLPARNVKPLPHSNPVLLTADRLNVSYPHPKQTWINWLKPKRMQVLRDVSITLRKGETLGVVGESGSGKSTLIQALLQLIRTDSGTVKLSDQNLKELSGQARRSWRAKVQVVFQDPFGSLSPRRTIAQTIGEGLQLHRPDLSTQEHLSRVKRALKDVGLEAARLDAYPHEFSGGQRQRIAIARALVLEPEILILDEPTSALDVSIQKQVLETLGELQCKYGLAYLLITHDLSVVHALSHRILVLKDGEVVEEGSAEQIIHSPKHTYTQRLVNASF